MQKKSVLNPTVLVTVQGPRKTFDLELPGDVPVSELLPFLLEICAFREKPAQKDLSSPNRLQVIGAHASLAPALTLIEAGVCNGSVLVLKTSTPPASLAPPSFVPRLVQPTRKTGGIGVTWESLE